MSGTLTIARPLGPEPGDYVVRSATTAATIDHLPYRDSATRSLSRMTRDVMLPLVSGVALIGVGAIGAAAVPGLRRVFSAVAVSRSAFAQDTWLAEIDDAFYVTEESADAAEVRALNALLNLPTTSGFELDLPD